MLLHILSIKVKGKITEYVKYARLVHHILINNANNIRFKPHIEDCVARLCIVCMFISNYFPIINKGGRRSPAVACWASDHWVASSNPLRGKFRH